MNRWQRLLYQWLEQNLPNSPDSVHELRNRFIALFRWPSLPTLTLEQYALGHDKYRDSFCYWLEWITRPLGSVSGGGAAKWGLWWSRSARSWRHSSRYRNPNEALYALTNGVFQLARAAENGSIDRLDEIGANLLGAESNVLRMKPLYLYFPNLFLPITNPDHLDIFLRQFALEPVTGVTARNRQLLAFMRSRTEFDGFDTVQLMRFLYDMLFPVAPPIGNRPAFKRRTTQFASLFADTATRTALRTDQERVVATLGPLLAADRLSAPDLAKPLELALNECRTPINNLANWPSADNFAGLAASTSSARLARLFGTLFDRQQPLPDRMERFQRAIDAEYAYLYTPDAQGRAQTLPASLLTIFLAARDPLRYMVHRPRMVEQAAQDWGMEPPDTDRNWYVHLLNWLRPIQDALTAQLGAQTDLIDVHLLLWFNHRFDADFAHRFGEDAAGNPVLLPEPPLPLRPLYEATRRTQTIALCGPPGTNKTQLARHFVTHWLLSRNHSQTDADAYWAAVDTGNAAAIMQHTAQAWQQRTGIGDFAVAIALDERTSFDDVVERSAAGQAGAVAGPLRRICERAAAEWRALGDAAPRYALLLEHLERTDLAAVLGNVLPLFDTDCRLGAPDAREVRLPYSGKSLGVPPNLLILGTLDGAVALPPATDAALRRRFTFVELSPDPDALSEAPLRQTDDIDLAELLTVLNGRLAATKGRTFQLGHHLLLDVRTIDDLRQAWYNRVVPQVRAWFANEEEKLPQILGETFVERRSARPRWQAALSVPPDALPSTYEIRILDRDEFRWAIQELAAGGA